jgi:uncharacterized protein with von Willebrand factor type A (vWA) domain
MDKIPIKGYATFHPLKHCWIGSGFRAEWFKELSIGKNDKIMDPLKRIAEETEEDYQKLIKILESFNVTVVRNDISENREDHFWAEHYSPPPMTPRDHTAMIGEKFYMPGEEFGYNVFDDVSEFQEEFSILQSNKKLTSNQKIAFQEKLQDTLERRKIDNDSDDLGETSYLEKVKSILRSINHNPLTTFPNNKKFNTFSSI